MVIIVFSLTLSITFRKRVTVFKGRRYLPHTVVVLMVAWGVFYNQYGSLGVELAGEICQHRLEKWGHQLIIHRLSIRSHSLNKLRCVNK